MPTATATRPDPIKQTATPAWRIESLDVVDTRTGDRDAAYLLPYRVKIGVVLTGQASPDEYQRDIHVGLDELRSAYQAEREQFIRTSKTYQRLQALRKNLSDATNSLRGKEA